MVFILVVATVFLLIAVDYFVRREDLKLKHEGDLKRSPIFLAPEKALLPVAISPERAFHLSHTWAQPAPQQEEVVYIGLDEFMPQILASDVKVQALPLIGAHLPQGAPVWRLQMGDRYLEQLSPVSGTVIDINPACRVGVPLPSDKIEQSWILKIQADRLEHERRNLMNPEQAHILNHTLRDELYLQAQRGDYLNDGGRIDPEYIAKMDRTEWEKIIKKFFPYQKIS
jgi:glycine cleavage system H lipoate-binding protein